MNDKSRCISLLSKVSSGPYFRKINVPGIYRVIQKGTSLNGIFSGRHGLVVARWPQSRGLRDRYCSGASFIKILH